MIGFSDHQVGLDHVPDRPPRAISVMALRPLPIVTVGPFDVVGGPGAVEVVDESGF